MKAQHSLDPVTTAWPAVQNVPGLRHIEDEQDYDASVALADALLDAGALNADHENHALFLIITDLIYAFDQRHHRQTPVHGVDLLRFLMTQHGLNQAQLPEIGTQSVVSEILSGKRELTVGHIRGLSSRFNLSPAAFF